MSQRGTPLCDEQAHHNDALKNPKASRGPGWVLCDAQNHNPLKEDPDAIHADVILSKTLCLPCVKGGGPQAGGIAVTGRPPSYPMSLRGAKRRGNLRGKTFKRTPSFTPYM